MAEKFDYYEALGVNKNATDDEIKSAYRRMAKKYHPDLYSTKPEAERKAAEEQFKKINHAYDVLSDKQKRAAYDQYGDENGPTVESLYEKYGSWQAVLEKALGTNAGMDACLGFYDEYYDMYDIGTGTVEKP